METKTATSVIVFMIASIPFLVPSLNPEPQSFWQEIVACVLLGGLLMVMDIEKER